MGNLFSGCVRHGNGRYDRWKQPPSRASWDVGPIRDTYVHTRVKESRPFDVPLKFSVPEREIEVIFVFNPTTLPPWYSSLLFFYRYRYLQPNYTIVSNYLCRTHSRTLAFFPNTGIRARQHARVPVFLRSSNHAFSSSSILRLQLLDCFRLSAACRLSSLTLATCIILIREWDRLPLKASCTAAIRNPRRWRLAKNEDSWKNPRVIGSVSRWLNSPIYEQLWIFLQFYAYMYSGHV